MKFHRSNRETQITSRDISRGAFWLLSMVSLCALAPGYAYSQIRSSANYQIQSDVISSGGSDNSSSANFNAHDTLGDVSDSEASSANYKLKAGYRSAAGNTSISITVPSAVTMSALSIDGRSAVASSSWVIETDNSAGYTATIKSSSIPALVSTNTSSSFADYGTSTRTTWSVSNSYKFGWSAFGSHVQGFGSGSSCSSSANVPSATLLWQGFNGSTAYAFASSSAANTGGTETKICFATEEKGTFAPAATYKATLTVTATPN